MTKDKYTETKTEQNPEFISDEDFMASHANSFYVDSQVQEQMKEAIRMSTEMKSR